ncbi:MAG: heme o synthase [Candidatus Limnocylindrales bacterium]
MTASATAPATIDRDAARADDVPAVGRPRTGFEKLTLVTLATTFLLIVVGGIVRSTESGLGCPDWPLCYGEVLPPLDDAKAWIEWTHRTVAAAIGFLVLGMAALALRDHRRERGILGATLGAVALTGFQAVLGKITVETGNAGSAVTAHLATAMLLLALLIFIATRSRYPARLTGAGWSQRFTLLAMLTAGAVYALLLFGSNVTAARAALVFPDWPLFDGSLLPRLSAEAPLAELQVAHVLHRLAAAIVGVIVVVTAWSAWRDSQGRSPLLPPGARPGVLALTATAAALYAIQVIVGGLQILTTLAPWTVALHLGLGAAIWGLLAAAAFYAYFEARTARVSAGSPPSPGTPGEGTTAVALSAASASRGDRVRAYIALTKPRIIELLLVTTVPAMFLAARGLPRPDLVLWTLLGGALAAGSANAINQYLEQDIDQLMSRTRRRPLPAHQVDPENALLFGLALGVVAFAELALLVNVLSAFLALVAIAFYVVVYTMLLKRNTPQNIVIGGAAGALPPVIGWTAVTGEITLPALLLFAIVFYCTPPHFWALSLRLAKDYRAAGVPMLPVVRGVPETTRQIALYSVLMVALSLAFFAVAQMGLIYLVAAAALGAGFLYQAVAMWREGTEQRAVRLYRYSTTYLAGLFAVMILDVAVPVVF